MSNKIALYCRPGFEKECAAEITDKAGQKTFLVLLESKKIAAMLFLSVIRLKMPINLPVSCLFVN